MKCKNCRNSVVAVNVINDEKMLWCIMKADSIDLETERDCDIFDCMTNADRIRNMTDEELAEHILTTPAYETCIKFCKNREECYAIMEMDNDIPEEWCKQCLLEWLQEEVK